MPKLFLTSQKKNERQLAMESIAMLQEPAVASAARQKSLPSFEIMGAEGGSTALLDAMDHESVMFNLDASLRVYARHHFFEWTQGLLQNLVKHDLLLCARSRTGAGDLHADTFGTFSADSNHYSDAFRRDSSFVPQLVRSWMQNRFEPVYCRLGAASDSPFQRLLERLGASGLYAHGTYDSTGSLQTFFIFAGDHGERCPRDGLLLSLIVPFLHAAWVRTEVSNPGGGLEGQGPHKEILTARQKEILQWVYLGKSNIEIGMILGVSPLTVKNHVQKILRKLDVQNRTQAIARSVELRILGQ